MTIRNSIVHDVYGDGIVLFQVEDGLIERSAAWRTGLQPRETIGTPNGIWTWRCRRCTVQWTEGFFVDSPGVDGGVYDIDWGNDDNVVQHNFGHDSMGYCASVFAAAGETTTNSTVRHNVCVNNGRSPKLARRQGDLFISTWDGGKLDGVRIHNNTFYWNPPIDAPAVQMDHADFAGTRANVFQSNLVHSTVPRMVHSNEGLRFDHNLYWYAGASRAGVELRRSRARGLLGLPARQRPGRRGPLRRSEADGHDAPAERLSRDRRGGADIGALEHGPAERRKRRRRSGDRVPGQLGRSSSHLAEDDASRAQLVFLQSALEQFGERGLVRGGGIPRRSLGPAGARLEPGGHPDLRAWPDRGRDGPDHAPRRAGRHGGPSLGGLRSARRPGPHPASPARATRPAHPRSSCPGTSADRQKGRVTCVSTVRRCCCFSSSPAPPAAARDYFVSATGDDSRSGSAAEPWRTLAKVNATSFQPGDRVLLEGGRTFAGPLELGSDDRGTPARNIVVTSYGVGRAIIDGGNGRAVTVDGCDHVLVQRLKLVGAGRKTGNTTDGLYLAHSTGSTVDQVEVYGFRHSGVEISGTQDARITNVHAHQNGYAGINSGGDLSKNLYIGYCLTENNPGDPSIRRNHSGSGIIVSQRRGGAGRVLRVDLQRLGPALDRQRPGGDLDAQRRPGDDPALRRAPQPEHRARTAAGSTSTAA